MEGRFPLLIVKGQSWKWPFYREIRENAARNDSLGQSDKNSSHAVVKRPRNGHVWDNNAVSYEVKSLGNCLSVFLSCHLHSSTFSFCEFNQSGQKRSVRSTTEAHFINSMQWWRKIAKSGRWFNWKENQVLQPASITSRVTCLILISNLSPCTGCWV